MRLFDFIDKKVDYAKTSVVTAELIEQYSFKKMAFHIGVSYIANTISKCPIRVYKENEEDTNEFYYKLNVSPNQNENSSQMINRMIEQLYYYGEAIIVPYQNNLQCPKSFVIEDSNPLKENVFSDMEFGQKILNKKFKASDVFYFKLDDENVNDLVDDIYKTYGKVLTQAVKSFNKSNGTKYKLNLKGHQAGDKKFQETFETVIQEQLKTFIENDNAVYPQFEGIDLQEFSSKSPQNSSDLIAVRKEFFEVTAQALKIPISIMLGNITNMKEIVKVFVSSCIDPLADMISEEFTRKYFTYEEWKKGCYVKVDTSAIDHVDILDAANSIYNAVGSGALNIDDIRKRLGMNPLNTEFSKTYFVSKNFELAENVLNPNIEKGGE